MKLIDRYILKHFIINFLFGILCFIIIFILVDLFENLDKFIDNNIPLESVLYYYYLFLPEIIKLITPLSILLASLFTISRFINFSEYTAMKSAGISIYRYLLPILIFGIILTGFFIYFNGWIVPKSNSKKFEFERVYLKRNIVSNQVMNLHFQDKNRIISIGHYDKFTESCYNITIAVFNPDTLTQLDYRIDAKQMLWDKTRKDWQLISLFQRQFFKTGQEKIQFYSTKYISEIEYLKKINLTPDLIFKRQLKPEELNLQEFKAFIDNLKESGLDTTKSEVDYYSQISFPFSILVTIIFGVSVSSNRRRGGAALQFGISIIVCFIYLGFVKISQSFGYNGDISPILTAWLANITFSAISIVNFYRLHRY
ncbi:MAG: LptF/LptG family permease [Ignavibacteria bacterium]|nr:LptF/LptG family permease [Ignavibacteria bacterium]